MREMNHELYVSPLTAMMLKDRGYDWKVTTYYPATGRELDVNELHVLTSEGAIDCQTHNAQGDDRVFYPAPTLDVALRWLREKKGLHVTADISTRTGYYKPFIAQIAKYPKEGMPVVTWHTLQGSWHEFYEQAVAWGLDYALGNLIHLPTKI